MNPHRGAVHGVVRDLESEQPLGFAVVVAQPAGRPGGKSRVETTDERGRYRIDGLDPGRYRITGYYADRTVQYVSVAVSAGRTTEVDIGFDPAGPDRVSIGQEFGPTSPARARRIVEPGGSIGDSYAVSGRARTGQIAGTVVDAESGRTMTGAVVAATTPTLVDAQLAVVDDDGRFRIPHLPPARYVVAVYYHLIGRGSIEVRRSGVEVTAGRVTPLDLRLDLRVAR